MDRKKQGNMLASGTPTRERLLRGGYAALLTGLLICGLAGCGEPTNEPTKIAEVGGEKAGYTTYAAPVRPAPSADEAGSEYQATIDGVTYVW